MSLPQRWFSRDRDGDSEPALSPPAPRPRGPRIVILGPCASGKSTLAAGLRELGFDAVPVAQEHSDIPTLWRRSEPAVVVALDVDLATIRRRRADPTWPDWLFHTQQRRLSRAAAEATLRIDTTAMPAAEILELVASHIRALEAGISDDAVDHRSA